MKITVAAIHTTKRKNKNRFTTKLPRIPERIRRDVPVKELSFDGEEFSATSDCSVTGTNSIQQLFSSNNVTYYYGWRPKVTIVNACGYGGIQSVRAFFWGYCTNGDLNSLAFFVNVFLQHCVALQPIRDVVIRC